MVGLTVFSGLASDKFVRKNNRMLSWIWRSGKQSIFLYITSTTRDILILKLFIVYLKFTFNLCSVFLFAISGNLIPYLVSYTLHQGLPRWLSGKKKIHLPSRELRFDPWVRKIPWWRNWQPTPMFLPGKSHGQRSLQATVHGSAKSGTWLNSSNSSKLHLD